MSYPTINEQLKEFKVYWLMGGEFEELPAIKTTNDYSHYLYELHHYIKEQQYYRYPERYKGMQKFILLHRGMHADLHSAMTDARFYEKYKIHKSKLLYNGKEDR